MFLYAGDLSYQHGAVPTSSAQPAEVRGRLDRAGRAIATLPPASFFTVSAVFHYLGPSLAVLLFAHVGVLGVAWLRILGAAVLFAAWRRPWRRWREAARAERRLLLALGVVLAAMNSLFYLAIDRLPLSTVGAIEFLGTVILAAAGARSGRNLLALALAVCGVAALTDVRLAGEPLGFAFAFANCAGFVLYVVLGHRIATTAGPRAGTMVEPMSGIDRLAASMLVAAVVATPFGIGAALPAFTHPSWLLWGIGVGVCSSVIPYVADQLAMARLPRATFALMLALLPATATVLGLLVLGQVPTAQDLLGVGLVIVGVAVHQPAPTPSAAGGPDADEEVPWTTPGSVRRD
jgi:inner membrane transporter RhtA